jgi:hypothetical protein
MPHSPPQKLIRPDVADGSISTKQGRPSHVALRPASDRTADIDVVRLVPSTDLLIYSIASSALPSNDCGTAMLSALAS